MTSLILDGDKVIGVEAVDNGGMVSVKREFHGPVILATGHSARDVYRYLADAGIEMEAKGIAVGVRLEHPSHLIDQIQYHNKKWKRGKYLPNSRILFCDTSRGSWCLFLLHVSGRLCDTFGYRTRTNSHQWDESCQPRDAVSNAGMVVQLTQRT